MDTAGAIEEAGLAGGQTGVREVRLVVRTMRKRLWLGIGAAVLAAVAATSAFGGSAAKRPALAVAVKGPGTVVSRPRGISCPPACKAAFAPRTTVLLNPKTRNGSRFRRWGGACTGTGAGTACRVRLASSAHVTAEFVRGPAAPQGPVAEPGSYYVNSNTGESFYVALGGRDVLNIFVSGVSITCTPAASSAPTRDDLVIARAAIKPNGSFAGKGSQTGLFAGFPATFTYSFAGRFTAATATNKAGGAGTLREDIVFKDNVTHRCTSNTQPWTALKSGPIPQKASLVQPGTYYVNSNTGETFSVAARNVLNISISNAPLACTPAASGAPSRDQIVIPRAAIKADGSFAGKATQTGVFAQSPATFTYSFSGSFQGLDSSGTATAGGLMRENIVFKDSAGTHTCTSNDQLWRAARQGWEAGSIRLG